MERAARTDDPRERLQLATELCSTSRHDLALKLLEGDRNIEIDLPMQLLQAKALEAGGHLDEAWATALGMLHHPDRDSRHIVYAVRLAVRIGTPATGSLDYQALFAAFDEPDLAADLPIEQLSRQAAAAFLKAMTRRWPLVAAKALSRYGIARAKIFIAIVFSALFLACIRAVTGKRRVVMTSMGRFTRLADLVDRLDPLLRRHMAQGDDFAMLVFFFGGYPNQQLLEMYKRHCRFVNATNAVSRRLAQRTIQALRLAGKFTETTVDYRFIQTDFMKNPPALSFTPEEEKSLKAGIRGLGIDPERPFICFGLRDMAYYRFYGDVMNVPLSQQRRRGDTDHRCPPLASYAACASYWADKGYQVIRMGLRVSEPLPEGTSPLVIDYASKARTDAMDAYLFAHCAFLIAGDTGLFSGAAAFDRPTVLSDLYLIRNTMYSSNKQARSIFVPKLVRDIREDRLLTFRELVNFNHVFAHRHDCEENGFQIVHNSAEDLIDATSELTDRMAGKHVDSPEDRNLQARYHAIYVPAQTGYKSTGLISAKFLRKYAHLLD